MALGSPEEMCTWSSGDETKVRAASGGTMKEIVEEQLELRWRVKM